MPKNSKPPGRRSGKDDGYEASDVEIVAMTIRHGAEYTKRHLNSMALERAARGIEDGE